MIIIGIDPGLANTGWGIVETRGSRYRCRAYDCIHTDASEPLAVRLYAISSTLTHVVERYAPEHVAIEEIFFGQNARSAVATAQARGAALAALAACGLEIGEYTPMQIKQAVVGTGTADKAQVTYMVRRVLGLDHDPKPDHCADALAAAVCYAHLSGSFGRIDASPAAGMARISSSRVGATDWRNLNEEQVQALLAQKG